jgi:Site-specific DNA methylase
MKTHDKAHTLPIADKIEDTPLLLVVDCFCGAGGTTTGFRQAKINGQQVAKVIACINHDPKAIKTHSYNHPDAVHYHEDIRTLDLSNLITTVRRWRQKYPKALLVLWASLECTNFSRAKAGKPKNPDSRTLAEHLYRYIDALQPHYIQIENVVEFKSWGPLDDHGRPVDKQNGRDWLKWRQHICLRYGYVDSWRELNSANFGAYTSRNRLFGIFAKRNLPVLFPEITHSKNGRIVDLFTKCQQWKAVREVLELDKTGTSIFERKKPLSEKTLSRIYDGLRRFVQPYHLERTVFLTHYYGKGFNTSINDPLPTITTKERAALVVAHHGKCLFEIDSSDTIMIRKIKEFMHANGLADLSIRMLLVQELLKAQGFPCDYRFAGNSGDQIKFIGNSVVPVVVQYWAETLALHLRDKPVVAA